MPLDYSQKRLLSMPLRSHKRNVRLRKLQVYAVITGLVSMLLSLATLVIRIVR